MDQQKQEIGPLLHKSSVGTPGEVTIRQFKRAISGVGCLTN